MTTIPPFAINATIAELLEPFVTLPKPQIAYVLAPSPHKCWEMHYPNEWQPLDFLHDARGTVMLEDWMYEKYGYVLFSRQVKKLSMTEPCMTWVNVTWRTQTTPQLFKEQSAPTRKEAVAHAFLRANGIEVSE